MTSPSFLISPATNSLLVSNNVRTPSVPVEEDRRCVPRVSRCLRARLMGQGLGDVSCETRDISEGGAFVLAPLKCGVGVGQRLEIIFESADDRFAPAESGFATVVRTEPAHVETGDPAVGIGLRFDQPVYF